MCRFSDMIPTVLLEEMRNFQFQFSSSEPSEEEIFEVNRRFFDALLKAAEESGIKTFEATMRCFSHKLADKLCADYLCVENVLSCNYCDEDMKIYFVLS